MSADRLLTLLIPAVGGQGGGVLSEWIVEAAARADLLAHATSIPGVAQRTGSTTYYVEIYAGAGDAPAFSLYPIPGGLDVLLAPELLEVGRMIELGFPSPARTTIVASTHRLYSIHEKITTAGDVYPSERLRAAAAAFARRLVAFDALALAREHGTEVNAILLGALAGSEALPISADAYRAAIEAKGVQVKGNVQGFEIGLAQARREPAPMTPRPHDGAPAPGGERDDPAVMGWPDAVRAVVRVAVPRLVDYQDRGYAARYLDRLRPFVGPDADAELAATVARRLAVWMTYEDAIRVADLKTRPARLARIRAEAGARDAEVIVTDYLKPDLDEIYGILPHRLVTPLARWAERRWPHGRPSLGQHVRTTTITGYLRLWVLARCRALRPRSHRAHQEHARMERWLAAVAAAAAWSADLAKELALAADLVKGYGDVRRRMQAAFDDLLDTAARVQARLPARGADADLAVALVRRYRDLVRQGPEGEMEAASLARDVLRALDGDDLAGARAHLGTA